MWSTLTQLLVNRPQHVCWTVVGVNWLTLCLECCREVFWADCCSSCTPRSFFILEDNLVGYADDSTLLSVVPLPCMCLSSLNLDLDKFSEWWCDF